MQSCLLETYRDQVKKKINVRVMAERKLENTMLLFTPTLSAAP